MSRGHSTLIWITLGLAVTIGFISLYSKFEYTLVSEIRERIVGAESKDGVALGELLFDTRGCSGCHTLGKLSNATFGPDLTTIAVTASAREIRDSIINPDAEISENCLDGRGIQLAPPPTISCVMAEKRKVQSLTISSMTPSSPC